MKRLPALLLVLLLFLCGCNIEPTPSTPSGGDTGELVRPDVAIVDFSAPALVIRVTINPELELTLSQSNVILEAKPLNEDAESLLADLELKGQPYSSGIVTILEEAKEQEFLTDTAKVSISTREATAGAWTPASQMLLSNPVEEFREESGMRFSCDVYPAGAVIDPSKLELRETQNTDEYYREVYYDYSGYHRMSKYFYHDGSYVEEFCPPGYELISVTQFPNGTYSYLEIKDLVASSYTVLPDGSCSSYMIQWDADRNKLWQMFTDVNGMVQEEFFFYEGGRLTRSVMIDFYGNEFETIYGADGSILSSDNDYEIQNPDGTTTIRHPDGSSTLITYYDNGVSATQNRTYPNGDYENFTYREDGTLLSSSVYMEQVIINSTYDEEGLPQSDTVYRADGTVINITFYKNGNPATSKLTYPNGEYENSTFYENGNLAEFISLVDGVYTEEYFDESGNQIE